MARSLGAAEQATGRSHRAAGKWFDYSPSAHAAPNLLLAHPNTLARTLKGISCTISQSRTYGFGAARALSLKFQSYWPDYLLRKPASGRQAGVSTYSGVCPGVAACARPPAAALMNYSPRHGTQCKRKVCCRRVHVVCTIMCT